MSWSAAQKEVFDVNLYENDRPSKWRRPQSFEPVSIITNDGQVYSGIVRDDNGDTLVLQLDAQKQIRLRHSEIEEQRTSPTSIMPAGLDKHLSDQQLIDLIKFLKASQ